MLKSLIKSTQKIFLHYNKMVSPCRGHQLNQELTEALVNTFQLWNDQQWNDLPDLAKI